jgi:hypothetical protein
MKEKTIETIKAAFEALKTKGIKQTQLNVSTEANLSIRTVKRHWARVTLEMVNRVTLQVEQSTNRVTPTVQKTSSNSFDTFKRRANNTPKTFTPFTVDKL